jgi:DNA polymerase (family 10)
MDSRTAAHALSQIAAYLELKGENSFKCRAYAGAAQGLLMLGAEDLGPLYRSGELGAVRGLGPATLAVVRDLIETGESRYLEQLRESMPEGLLDMLDVPGLSPLRIHRIHEALGIETVEELEAAAHDGRLAALPKFGPKTVAKILKGIASAREHGPLQLYHHAFVEAQRLLASVASHPDVVRAELAGGLRRRVEVAASVDIVAACARKPVDVAQSFTRLAGVESATGDGASVWIRFIDGAELNLYCVDPDRFAVALWHATGSGDHVDAVSTALASKGIAVEDDRMRDSRGAFVGAPTETAIYAAAGLAFIEPELREGLGEVDAARRGTLPALVVPADLRGVLHCHTHYSDGKASVGEMAQAAKQRGWSYIGITDHSQAAFFAGGLTREAVRAQHDEIDELNALLDGFRVLKGIEADILVDGQLDYGDELLDEFDFVVGSIHSRFSMDRTTMTDRVLRALDDPRLTIIAHPTGRLLLSREPYAIDIDAVLEKAAASGVAVELNADPRRLDLDWRHLQTAKRLGVTIAIGPDAHSTRGLDNMEVGVGIARKGWLERGDVLNARSADEVLAFARARHNTRSGRR